MKTRLVDVVLLGALAAVAGACGDGGGDGGASDAAPDGRVADAAVTPPIDAGPRDGAVVDADPDAPDAEPVDADVDAEPADAEVDAEPADAAVPTGARHHMVASALRVPRSASESAALGLDLDGDPSHRPDNAMGGIFAALAQQGIDPQAQTNAAIAAGELVSLHVLQTTSLGSAPVAFWSVFEGAPHPAPDFSGHGSFAIAPGAPLDSLLVGPIQGGHFVGGPGKARVQVAFMGIPLTLDLIGARIDATVTDGGCEGRLGGAVPHADVVSKVYPQVAAGFTAILHADPGCPLHCTGSALTLENLFDTDHDGVISTAEVSASALLQALFAPDVDLLDASGHFNPRQDHVTDSLSLGVGLTCVGASFTAPGE